jgi:transcriptional regulator with XRE-family HTH domain
MVSSTGTAKARTLGAALKRAREQAGIGLRELERRTGGTIKNSSWSRVESGERLPPPEQVIRVLDELGVPDAQREVILDVMGAEDTGHSWLPVGVPEPRSHLVAMLEFERTTQRITQVAMTVIPGLLQTAEYARAIIRAEAPAADVEPRVAVRVGRREILNRRNPVQMTALIGEAAITADVGGREVMDEQLRHLLAMSEKPNIDIRIVPAGIDYHPGMVKPLFSVFDFESASPILHIEVGDAGLYLHEEADVDSYRDAANRVLGVALTPKMSVMKVTELLTGRMERT